LFTSTTKDAKTTIDGKPVPLEKKQKVFGVIHDTMYSFCEHCKQEATKKIKRNNILKALSGTQWGQQKETIVCTYKAISRSVVKMLVLFKALLPLNPAGIKLKKLRMKHFEL
jgi:hypothetical protein